jgi:hypothetical protein
MPGAGSEDIRRPTIDDEQHGTHEGLEDDLHITRRILDFDIKGPEHRKYFGQTETYRDTDRDHRDSKRQIEHGWRELGF